MKLQESEIQEIASRLTSPLVVFDLETTGIDKTKDEIVQFYGFRIEPNGVYLSMEFKCKPSIPISDEAAAVHGITNEELEFKESFSHYTYGILELFRGAMVGGYNVFNFDLPILNRQLSELGHHGVFKDTHVLDSFKLAMLHHPRDLSSMFRVYTGEEMENAHDASADVIATMKILTKQLSIESEEDITTLASKTSPPPSERVGLSSQIVFVNGEAVFNFGKHKGQRLTDNRSYCAWMLGSDFDEDIKAFIRSVLK